MSVQSGAVRTPITVRSYELDSFGHLNHAAFLNHFEYARFHALAEKGFPIETLLGRGEAIHVVRVEVDYRAELKMGQAYEVVTEPETIRNSSLVLRQRSVEPADDGKVYAEALVTIVWIGPGGRPVRVPDDIRAAFNSPPSA